MNHLDEGTIHAWLDDALSATEAAEADAHVKGCAECSAKVAEARGLIAASSRILTALDDTPANVIPKPAVAPARRHRNVAPWISGLAAAAILVTVWRTGDVQQPAPMVELKVPEIPQVQVPEPSLAPLSQPAPPPRIDGAVAVTAQTAPAPVAPVAAAEESQRREAFSDAVRRARSDSAETAASRALRSVAASVAADQSVSAENPLRLAGCYRLPSVNRSTEIVTTAAGSAARAARSAAGAPAPAAQVARSEAAAPSTLLRLDTLTSGQGFAIRDAHSGNSRGMWHVLSKDSARVTIPAVGTFTLAVFDKVACPER